MSATARTMRSAILAGALIAMLTLGAAASSASASEPWWHVDTVYAPPASPGGEGTVQVEVSNLGDAPTEGTWTGHLVEALIFDETKGFIKVVEKLPPGLTTEGVKAFEPVQAIGGGGAALSYSLMEERRMEEILAGARQGGRTVPQLCSESAQTVTCLYGTPVRQYERIILSINVKSTPGAAQGPNEVSVSGGGARPVSSRSTIDPDKALPAFGVEGYEVTPEEEGGAPVTQAGSHPFQLTTTLELNTKTMQVVRAKSANSSEGGRVVPEVQPIALTKDLRFKLPPGLVGNPTPLPQCSLYTFVREKLEKQPECPANTVVGVATSVVTDPKSFMNVPLAISSPLYSLVPNVGEPARFGFQAPTGPVILGTSVQTGGDYGVIVTVPNIISIPFMGSQVTFWGVPADPRHDSSRGKLCLEDVTPQYSGGEEFLCSAGEKEQPFLMMPTACTGPLHTTVEADPWSAPGQFSPSVEYSSHTGPGGEGEPYGQDGCNRMSFEPSIQITPDGKEASTPTGLTVGIHVPQEASLSPTGLADSTVRDTEVKLPAGVVLNPAAGDGLAACSTSQLGLEVDAEQQCPDASKVGTVEIETPLLPHRLEGAAYLAQQNANPFGSLLALYLVVKDPYSGVIVKLAGEIKPDPATGQLTSTFDETPQLPFENLRLNFFGGSRAPLGTPPLCGSYTTTASITPWSGNPPVASSSAFEIDSGPNHSACQSPLPFAPTFTAGSTSIQSAGFSPLTMTMSREDGNQNLDAITLHMPPGLSGMLSGIPLCGEADANAGTCPAASQIGETTISVGLGGNPFTVFGGKVYITGPYKGAPYGLAIVNPAKAGPIDVEHDTSKAEENMPACDCVVVRAKIEVDPTTAAITVTSDTTGPHRIPTILDGVPLEIKHVNVTINRPGFIFNPTNCERMAITGDLTSSEGATDSLATPFQVTNCATLGFKPQFAVATDGHYTKADGTSLKVKLSYPNAPFGTQANIAKVRVELPEQLPSRLTTLQKACPDTVFNTNPENCPAASKVGEARATTPIIPEDFAGPAYFVSHGGAKFPELIIALHGYALTVDLHGETFISKAGVTSTTFNSVPDVPIGTFELTLPAGPDSALTGNADLCASKLVMPTTFTAQNGTVIQERTPIHVEGCTPQIRVIRHSVAGKHATVVVRVPSAGTLVAAGAGVHRTTRRIGKAGTVTVTLKLSRAEQRFVAHHRGRRLRVPVKLSFSPMRGKRLKAIVAVLMK